MALGALIAGGASLLGGALGADASHDASRAQMRSLREGRNYDTANYLTQLGLSEPWRAGGQAALNELLGFFGYPQQQYQSGVDIARQNLVGAQASNNRMGAKAILKLLKQGKSIDEISQLGVLKSNPGVVNRLGKHGISADQISQLQQGPMFGSPVLKPGPQQAPGVGGMSMVQNSPEFQLAQAEGVKDLNGTFGAEGQRFSGNALRELNNVTSRSLNDWLGRRFQLAGFGPQANAQAGQAGSDYGRASAYNSMAQGDARASGIANAGNIWGNALSGAGNAFGYYWGNRNQRPNDWGIGGPQVMG